MTVTAPAERALCGSVVRLDPTTPDDAPGLFAALDDDRVYRLAFDFGAVGRPDDVAAMRTVTDGYLAARALGVAHPGYRIGYTVRLVADGELGAAGTVVGTTSLMDISLRDERAHIGSTAYGPRWWGTAVNAECKLLLLGLCFDECGLGRVQLQTDAINVVSQAAISKLGATREGVLRRHKVRADGTFRDTVVYSILRDEWPQSRSTLRARLRG